MKNKILMLFVLLATVIVGCNQESTIQPRPSNAFVPVYVQPGDLADIRYIPTPQPTENAGKIYVYGNYIFQNDLYKGFHVIDNSNVNNPTKIGFIKVPQSTEIAIRSGILYTNNLSDLVAINIANPTNPVVTKKIANAFPTVIQDYPPFTGVNFECVDKSKGLVVRWELKQNVVAKCRR